MEVHIENMVNIFSLHTHNPYRIYKQIINADKLDLPACLPACLLLLLIRLQIFVYLPPIYAIDACEIFNFLKISAMMNSSSANLLVGWLTAARPLHIKSFSCSQHVCIHIKYKSGNVAE